MENTDLVSKYSDRGCQHLQLIDMAAILKKNLLRNSHKNRPLYVFLPLQSWPHTVRIFLIRFNHDIDKEKKQTVLWWAKKNRFSHRHFVFGYLQQHRTEIFRWVGCPKSL